MEFREIFMVVAKWLTLDRPNNGWKISWQSLENWLTGYQKANFHFGQSSTVGQTIGLVAYMVSPPQMPVPLKHMYDANILRAEFTIFIPNYPPMWYTIWYTEYGVIRNTAFAQRFVLDHWS